MTESRGGWPAGGRWLRPGTATVAGGRLRADRPKPPARAGRFIEEPARPFFNRCQRSNASVAQACGERLPTVGEDIRIFLTTKGHQSAQIKTKNLDAKPLREFREWTRIFGGVHSGAAEAQRGNGAAKRHKRRKGETKPILFFLPQINTDSHG